jgi:hypothetical protein
MRPHRKQLALIVGLTAFLAGCPSALQVGYRAMYIVRNAGDQASETLGKLAKEAHTKCLKDATVAGVAGPTVDVKKYGACIKKYQEAVKVWIDVVKPALNSALSATWGSLETARKVKDSGTKDWIALLKPGFCALLKALEAWEKSDVMPKKGKEIIARLKGIKVFLCH